MRINKYTGSPSTMLVICLNEPVRDMRRPPNEAYAVLRNGQSVDTESRQRRPYTTSEVPPSNL